MERENNLDRSKLRGHIFEIIIMELLQKNQFSAVDTNAEPEERIREIRPGFIEFKGRGCWHQIDCPCDYSNIIPFSYPLRILGEVKFFKKTLEKKYIREYIGVIKDIQENYFVADDVNPQDFYPRKMEIGVYFSANGFQAEAEKLAYAHGIKTISYENNFLINKIKLLVEELEKNYLSVKCLKEHTWNTFRQEFIDTLRNGYRNNYIGHHPYLVDGYGEIIEKIRDLLIGIKSSFIATTATGVFLHFVGDSNFPYELFQETDEGRCCVYYSYDNLGKRYFWLEISGDNQRRHFYFTPPESLDYAVVFGANSAIQEKERLFRKLNINISLNGIARSLTLHIDEDWLNAIRN